MKTYKDLFVCEICKYQTPKEFEGSEPNTCCACMPLDTEFHATCERNGVKLKKLPREFVTPPKTAQNGAILSNKELIFKIKQHISQIAKLTLAPSGDFTLYLSLEKLNDFFEELEKSIV